MSQANAETAVLQALQGDGALSPYGSAKVQMQDTTGYVALPIEIVNQYDIRQGYEVQRAYHPETGCVVTCLRDDVDLFDV
jgi:hypothetical protein